MAGELKQKKEGEYEPKASEKKPLYVRDDKKYGGTINRDNYPNLWPTKNCLSIFQIPKIR